MLMKAFEGSLIRIYNCHLPLSPPLATPAVHVAPVGCKDYPAYLVRMDTTSKFVYDYHTGAIINLVVS